MIRRRRRYGARATAVLLIVGGLFALGTVEAEDSRGETGDFGQIILAEAGAGSGMARYVDHSLAPDEADPFDVRRITTVDHLGRPHFRIRTRSALYLYDPVAGGFSSILDRRGNDWVAYADDEDPTYPAAAATRYRGVPNLVYGGEDDGVGHPGFAKCESRVTRRNQITTVSLSGEWSYRWTFFRNYARLEVLQSPEGVPYWFLYEGPAGGTYRPRSTWWATDLSEPSYDIPDHFQDGTHRGNHRYLAFGQNDVPYALWMLQADPDTRPDHVSYLGNEEIGAADSPDGMVVAGFGRAAGAKPLLTGPQTFLIGLAPYDHDDPASMTRLRRRIDKAARRYAPAD